MKLVAVIALALALAGCIYPRITVCNTKGACVVNAPTKATIQAPKLPVSLP